MSSHKYSQQSNKLQQIPQELQQLQHSKYFIQQIINISKNKPK